ncbi:MAG: hypothetical protein LBR34_04190 [Prevotella sp.]|jgi:hypothetical protein|nr:hypothetical protein [Prevotella sp.]
MGVYKMVSLIFRYFLFMIFIACSTNTNTNDAVSAENKRLKNAIEELRNENNANLAASIKQAEDINNIVLQLKDVSGKTLTIRQNMERGNIELSQVEKANEYLTEIKKKLDNVQQNDFTKEQIAIINNLKSIIEAKVKEIALLKKEIKEKTEELGRKNVVIAEQESTIQKKDAEISMQQALKWHEMGVKLYEISAGFENISKGFLGTNKNDYNKMRRNKKLLLSEAKKCFENALKTGVSDSRQYLAKVNEELSALE